MDKQVSPALGFQRFFGKVNVFVSIADNEDFHQ